MENPHRGLVAAHVFPVSEISQWNRNYKILIRDNGSTTEIGQSRLYSSQNGLLLTLEIQEAFDDFILGVDPDVRNSKLSVFHRYL